MRFQSPKAYKYFVDCKDNHKAWQSFEILLHGVILKLLELYRNSTCETPATLGFLNFVSETENATLSLISEIFLSFGLAIYKQRIGDQNNDFTVSNAGRYEFFYLFYAFNHPIYHKVEYRGLKNKVIYPEEIKNIFNENITFSATDITGKCLGGDFILEGKIKKQKNIACKGAVTAKTWQKIWHSIERVDDIVENTKSQLGIFDIPLSRNILLTREISEWQAVLCLSSFLNGEKNTVITNIYNKKLSNDLVDFTNTVSEKRNWFFKKALNAPLENVTYRNLSIKPDQLLENFLYKSNSSDKEETD